MLHTLGRRPTATAPARDAVDLLMDCHARIRAFTATAARLARALDAPPDDVASAATALRRYFTVAMPLHAADEDSSVGPRLRASSAPLEVRDAVATIAEQHEVIDRLIAALAEDWTALTHDPTRLPALATRMADDVATLDLIWGVHLTLEEDVVFPALRRWVEPGELARVVDEMAARRPASSFTREP